MQNGGGKNNKIFVGDEVPNTKFELKEKESEVEKNET